MFKMVNGSSVSKEFPCNAGNWDLIPGLGITWRRKWQPTPVFLPEKIPWMKEPGVLQSMRLQTVGHD